MQYQNQQYSIQNLSQEVTVLENLETSAKRHSERIKMKTYFTFTKPIPQKIISDKHLIKAVLQNGIKTHFNFLVYYLIYSKIDLFIKCVYLYYVLVFFRGLLQGAYHYQIHQVSFIINTLNNENFRCPLLKQLNIKSIGQKIK